MITVILTHWYLDWIWRLLYLQGALNEEEIDNRDLNPLVSRPDMEGKLYLQGALNEEEIDNHDLNPLVSRLDMEVVILTRCSE